MTDERIPERHVPEDFPARVIAESERLAYEEFEPGTALPPTLPSERERAEWDALVGASVDAQADAFIARADEQRRVEVLANPVLADEYEALTGEPLPPWEGVAKEHERLGYAADATGDPWPDPPDEAAYHGVLGEIVRAVEPITESDPVALLGMLLATFGALAGRTKVIYQGALQAPNLFVVLVGDTNEGRKGTALSIVRSVFDAANPDWKRIQVVGLGSGEGLIGYFVRENEKAEAAGRRPEHRALVIESEYGRLLRVMNREGSTLSPILRDAWDGAAMGRFLAREGAMVAWHHVGLIGHITPTELKRKLNDDDAANGYGNRHLWLPVRRLKLIAHPLNPQPYVTPFLEPLHRAIIEAQTPGELHWTKAAWDAWEPFYARIEARHTPGILGLLTARTASQVTRVALLFALLDRTHEVGAQHLAAAIAFIDYAERGAAFLFGRSTGDVDADDLLRQLRNEEMSRDQIRIASGMRTSAEATRIIDILVGLGLAEVTRVKSGGRGRPREIVRATLKRLGQ